jgi:hypothetical protein
MFLTGGFIFRQTAVATTGTVQYMSTCALHPGSSHYGSATVEAVLCGPGSSVGIVTDYGLDGPGSNPGGDEIFRPSRPTLRPTYPPVKWVLGLSRG